MANIFELLSKDGNITPEKARKSNAVSGQSSVFLGSSLSMRSFAIDEPGSLVRALYATLLDTTNISEHLIILLNVSDRYRKLTTLKHFYTLYKLCCKGWCLHMRMCKGHSKRQSQRRKFLTPKISNNQGLHPSESVLIIFKRVLPLLLCPRTLWWPGMFPRSFKVKYFQ